MGVYISGRHVFIVFRFLGSVSFTHNIEQRTLSRATSFNDWQGVSIR
jgi:hypothetical protein